MSEIERKKNHNQRQYCLENILSCLISLASFENFFFIMEPQAKKAEHAQSFYRCVPALQANISLTVWNTWKKTDQSSC